MYAKQRSCIRIYHCALQSIQHFLDNPHILEYVAQLGTQKLQASDNWFTRVETTMLADMLKLLKIVLPATVSAHTENILSLGYLVLFQSKHSCVLTETKPNTLSCCIHTAEMNQLNILSFLAILMGTS